MAASLILLVFCCLGALYEGILTIHLFWDLCYKIPNPIKWDISILSILTLILYTATSIFFIIYIVNVSSEGLISDARDLSIWHLAAIWGIIWNCAQISCYLSFFKRLRYSFDVKSQYSLSHCQMYFIYGSIIAYALSNLLLLPLLFRDKWNIDFRIAIYNIIYAASILILNLTIMGTVLYIFIKKLNNIAHQLNELFTISTHGPEYTNSSSIELSSYEPSNSKQYGSVSKHPLVPQEKTSSKQIIKVFNLISKLLILYGLMIISTQLTIMTIIFCSIPTLISDQNLYIIALYCYYITRNIDCIIGSTCIYLSFNQYKSTYMKCCKIPHKCIVNLCTKKAVDMSFDTYHM